MVYVVRNVKFWNSYFPIQSNSIYCVKYQPAKWWSTFYYLRLKFNPYHNQSSRSFSTIIIKLHCLLNNDIQMTSKFLTVLLHFESIMQFVCCTIQNKHYKGRETNSTYRTIYYNIIEPSVLCFYIIYIERVHIKKRNVTRSMLKSIYEARRMCAWKSNNRK